MRIATWNVNSIRTRQDRLLAWLEAHRPDALCLQETKVVDEKFPLAEIEALGFHAAFYGQKTYNGVAIISSSPPEEVVCGFADGEEEDPQARLIAATIAGVRVICGYFPNGSSMGSDKYQYKLAWLKRLQKYLESRHQNSEALALCGDYNIALDDRDLADLTKWGGGVLYNEEICAALADIQSFGFEDGYRIFDQEEGKFSWWDYRGLCFPRNDGLRIDHLFLTAPLAQRAQGAFIDRDQRKKGACPDGSKPSDHAPVVMDFE